MTGPVRIAIILLAVICLPLAFWLGWRVHNSSLTPANATSAAETSTAGVTGSSPLRTGSTALYAHNLMLRKGPDFRVYVRWLRGDLAPSKRNVTPSFDDPDSFALDIHDGIVRANIGDIAHYLNSGGLGNSPLKNVTLRGDGTQIHLNATLHKVISLPIEVTGELSVLPGNLIQLQVTKISVLKVPFKAVLGLLHVTVADFAGGTSIPGVQISENKIVFDTQKLLPPPHIRGELKMVHVVNPDLEEVFGNTDTDLAKVEQWRNFLRLKGGSLNFGKLTMNQVDLIMIDISDDAWFDLDLAHYQKQLVNGYTRMTPESALQIFMPDLSKIPDNAANQNIDLEWMKNRNAPVPSSVTRH